MHSGSRNQKRNMCFMNPRSVWQAFVFVLLESTAAGATKTRTRSLLQQLIFKYEHDVLKSEKGEYTWFTQSHKHNRLDFFI